jgi:hypothetical protein
MSEFATYRHSRWGSPRKKGEITPKVGAGGQGAGGGQASLLPIVPPHLKAQIDLFDITQTYNTEDSLLTTPRGTTRRPSPLRSARGAGRSRERVQQEVRRLNKPTFAVRGDNVVELLAELKAIEDLIGSLQDGSLMQHLPFVLEYFPISMRPNVRAVEHGLNRQVEQSCR